MISWAEGRLKKRWIDGTRGKPLEEQLNDFILGMLKVVPAVRRQREEREQREREWEEQRRRKAEEKLRRQEERRRLAELEVEADAWHRSRRFREYVKAVRQAAVEQQGKIDPASDLRNWLKWAGEQAERIAPLPRRIAAEDTPDKNRPGF